MRAVLALPLAAILFAGCSGDAPTNFTDAHEADASPRVTTLIEAWIDAQRHVDEDALEALYVDHYTHNGMTAHDMSEVHLLPETADTRVDTITWRLLEAPHADDDHYEHDEAAHYDHHATVMARIEVRGVVSADVIAHLDDLDPHHTHGAMTPAHDGDDDHEELRGTVRVTGEYEVVFRAVWDHDAPAKIERQRFETAALRFGGGLAATVFHDVHVHPHDAHPGEEIDVHGRYAMLPPDGEIRARIGQGEWEDADLDHYTHSALTPAHAHDDHDDDDHHHTGEIDIHLTAPHYPGRYLVRVEASAANLQSRTASLTIAEREVDVDDHHHD